MTMMQRRKQKTSNRLNAVGMDQVFGYGFLRSLAVEVKYSFCAHRNVVCVQTQPSADYHTQPWHGPASFFLQSSVAI